MKLAPQTNTNTDKVPYKFVIPFEEPSPDDDDDRKTLSFTLRNDPSQGKNSTTWVRTIQEFENGTPEELLLLLNAMDEICTGQSLDTVLDTTERFSTRKKPITISSVATTSYSH